MSTFTTYVCDRCKKSSTEFSDFTRFEFEGLSLHVRGNLCRDCIKVFLAALKGL